MTCAVTIETNRYESEQDAKERAGRIADKAANAERARILAHGGEDAYESLRDLLIDTKQRDTSAREGMLLALQGVLELAAKPAFSPLEAFNVMTRIQGALLSYADEGAAVEGRMAYEELMEVV